METDPDLVVTSMGSKYAYKVFSAPVLAIGCENFDVLPGTSDISITPNVFASKHHHLYSNIVEYDGMRQHLAGQEIPSYIQDYKKLSKN